jgi:hypothetical protein
MLVLLNVQQSIIQTWRTNETARESRYQRHLARQGHTIMHDNGPWFNDYLYDAK